MSHRPGHVEGVGFNPSGFDPSRQRRPAQRAFPTAPQASLDPTAIALQGAGGLAGAIANFIGGGQTRADQATGRRALKSQLGRPIFKPRDIVGQRKLGFIASAAPLARRANQQLGLGAGRAQEELISSFAGQEGDFLAELIRRELELRAQRDLQIGSQFFQAGR